ncbi:hypothetical protein CDAR_73771 [Caerostris darwini]|uniref:Secreted protein n=1 Tax=Caerostris darwini TaxID=1538125 RepID=A0AAV4MR30_9ARAC|nr:hypothetical protein CDAR_73771 [Caerostris darwini]
MSVRAGLTLGRSLFWVCSAAQPPWLATPGATIALVTKHILVALAMDTIPQSMPSMGMVSHMLNPSFTTPHPLSMPINLTANPMSPITSSPLSMLLPF